MNVLQAWLESLDDRDGKWRVDLKGDTPKVPQIQGVEFKRQMPSYAIRQTSQQVAVFVNGKATRYTLLKNHDMLRIGPKSYIFHATYVTEDAAPIISAIKSKVRTQRVAKTKKQKPVRSPRLLSTELPLFPWDTLFMPITFWKKALSQPLASVRSTILFWTLLVLSFAVFPLKINPHRPLVIGAYAFFALILFISTAMTSSVMFGFKKERRLSGFMRFTFYSMPFCLMTQSIYMSKAPNATAQAPDYFKGGVIIALVVAAFYTWQSKRAFNATWRNSLIFGTLVAIPWYSMMTGLMYIFI